MTKGILKNILTTVFFCFVMIQTVACGEGFQNGIVDMEIFKTPTGQVKLKVYTAKRYIDPLVVNKKPDNVYVIYMPETETKTNAPSVSNTAGLVKSVDVKFQPNNVTGKGYTKITITAIRPIEVVPEVEFNATQKVAKVAAKPILPAAKPIEKPTVKPAVKPTVTPVAKPVTKAQKPAKEVKPVQKPIKVAAKEETKPQPETKVEKPAELTAEPPVVSEQEKQPKLAPQLSEEKEKQEFNIPTPHELADEVKASPVGKAFAAAFFVIVPIIIFILLILGARKTISRVKRQKEVFVENLNEKPQEVKDFKEIIENEDMDWREKYKTYVEAADAEDITPKQEPKQDTVESVSLDHLFVETHEVEDEISVEEVFAEDNDEEVVEPVAVEETIEETVEEPMFEPVAETLEEPIEVEQPEPVKELQTVEETMEETTEETVEETMEETDEIEEVEEVKEVGGLEVISSFEIDATKGIYLVKVEDTTALVGHIGEEVFVLKEFSNKIEEKLQGRLSEMKQESAVFMIKLGSYKALVEVTPVTMKLLIEL